MPGDGQALAARQTVDVMNSLRNRQGAPVSANAVNAAHKLTAQENHARTPSRASPLPFACRSRKT